MHLTIHFYWSFTSLYIYMYEPNQKIWFEVGLTTFFGQRNDIVTAFIAPGSLPQGHTVNPLTPKSDQHVTSPYNIHSLSSKLVMRILKIIACNLLSWFNSKFLSLISKENLMCSSYWGKLTIRSERLGLSFLIIEPLALEHAAEHEWGWSKLLWANGP